MRWTGGPGNQKVQPHSALLEWPTEGSSQLISSWRLWCELSLWEEDACFKNCRLLTIESLIGPGLQSFIFALGFIFISHREKVIFCEFGFYFLIFCKVKSQWMPLTLFRLRQSFHIKLGTLQEFTIFFHTTYLSNSYSWNLTAWVDFLASKTHTHTYMHIQDSNFFRCWCGWEQGKTLRNWFSKV